MKTASTNKKIREIIRLVKEEKLIPQPEFQRRLIWTNKDKDHFLDSILRGFPFPEIYLADGDVDVDTGIGTQLLVDGLQRVSTIIEYFESSTNLRLYTISPYKFLSVIDKRKFLLYDVAVRDLGSISKSELIEVFKRINATNYSLLDIEINNAFYRGELKNFVQLYSEHSFFSENRVFNTYDMRRMGDLKFVLSLVITLLGGYFNRDDEFDTYLGKYNEDFSHRAEIERRLTQCFDYISECGFEPRCRIWKKADLFTLIVVLDRILENDHDHIQPVAAIDLLQSFYSSISDISTNSDSFASIYYKAALQANNDRANRIRRDIVIEALLHNEDEDAISGKLRDHGLV